jgi:hypothetical protein
MPIAGGGDGGSVRQNGTAEAFQEWETRYRQCWEDRKLQDEDHIFHSRKIF